MRGWRVRWRWYDFWVGIYFGPGEVFICPIPFLCFSYRWRQAR